MPSTMALSRNMYPDPKEMATAIGVWFACFMGGMTIGPLVGGVLLEAFTSALHGVAWAGAGVFLALAAVAVAVLRAPSPSTVDATATGPAEPERVRAGA